MFGVLLEVVASGVLELTVESIVAGWWWWWWQLWVAAGGGGGRRREWELVSQTSGNTFFSRNFENFGAITIVQRYLLSLSLYEYMNICIYIYIYLDAVNDLNFSHLFTCMWEKCVAPYFGAWHVHFPLYLLVFGICLVLNHEYCN